MLFVLQSPGAVKPPRGIERPFVVLVKDNWNDYSFLTYFQAHFFGIDGGSGDFLGSIRIMRLGQQRGERTFSPEVDRFNSLDELPGEYCALGENISFYENVA